MDCPFKNVCTSYPTFCRTCARNPKKDYYIPDHIRYISRRRYDPYRRG